MENLVNELAEMLSTANGLTPALQEAAEQIIEYATISSTVWLVISSIMLIVGIPLIICGITNRTDYPDVLFVIGIALSVFGVIMLPIAISALLEIRISPYGYLLKLLLS